MIPSFGDLVKQMESEDAIEAKHFDISLRFIKDLLQFVEQNDEYFNVHNESEMVIKSLSKSIAKKK